MTRREQTGALFLPLIDQDRIEPGDCAERARLLEEAGADALLVGSSFSLEDRLEPVILALREGTSVPVILFPGSAHGLSGEADAVLFLTLLSGRNPQYLVEEQVRSAPAVRRLGIEPIPVAYLLIGCGGARTVHYVSRTEPIPGDRPEIAMAHALAARYMGMRAVYLEAGSGADAPVPPALIRSVRDYAGLPVIAGGGIRAPEQAEAARRAGADAVVIGTALESRFSAERARAFAEAVHGGRLPVRPEA